MHNQELVLLLNRHRQKYRMSCSPSLIEIMLKQQELVDDDFYELQDKYKDQNVGLFFFADQNIKGLRIEKHDPTKGQGFIERLLSDYQKGSLIGLYCVTPNDPNRNCHGWIVSGIVSNTVYLLSKYSELGNGEGCRTAMLEMPLSGYGGIEITDLVIGFPEPNTQATE